MCGRFTLTASPEDVRRYFSYVEQPNFPPRYNIAPTQPVAIIRQSHDNARHFSLVRWGLMPAWVKNPASFTLLINARAETAVEKPSFRAAMKHGRCLFPMSGYYEWRRTSSGKQAFFIHPADGGLMAVAGLMETWSDPDGGDMDTSAILTTPANRSLAAIHNRMPAILLPGQFATWLDTGRVMARHARELLAPAENGLLVATPVSARVNSVANDGPDLVAEVAAGEVASEIAVRSGKVAHGGSEDGGTGTGGGQMSLF